MDGESVLSGFLRETPGGDGVAGGTVTVKLHSTDGAVGGMTDTTDADGYWDIATGYPGAFYVEVASGSILKVQSSKITGFVGTFALRDLPLIFRAFSDGYIAGFGDNLAVVVNTGMSVTVGTGMGVVHGNGYYHAADENVTVTAADGSNDRIDLVVVRFTKPGNTDAGKRALVVIAGTPAGSPVVPSPLDTSNFKDLPLAQILVPTGSSSVTSDRITDRRVLVGPATVDATKVVGALTATAVTTSTLATTGTVTLGDTDTDILALQGLMKTAGTDPTVSYGTGAGTGPSTGSIDGDTSGCRLVFTTGTAPAAAGANVFTLTFPTARANTNYRVLVQGVSRQAAIDNFYPFDSGRTTTTIGIAAEATLTASTEYRIDIWIIGH